MKIYTKTGDTGDTGLFGGPRVRKDSPRIEAYGTVDELNAVLGLARADVAAAALDAKLSRVQCELFDLGAELATPDPASHGVRGITAGHIARLESEIDSLEQTLPKLKQFILPGGTALAARLHLARTVCRRAERRLITLADHSDEPISAQAAVYLNRLSDWLFVVARAANQAAGRAEEPWRQCGDE
jgi:cob(I)alamin adenosyltransferase